MSVQWRSIRVEETGTALKPPGVVGIVARATTAPASPLPDALTARTR
ncbi:MAG: hypothetical protein ACREIT_02655 [Tepidisphaeraceae bacterium]